MSRLGPDARSRRPYSSDDREVKRRRGGGYQTGGYHGGSGSGRGMRDRDRSWDRSSEHARDSGTSARGGVGPLCGSVDVFLMQGYDMSLGESDLKTELAGRGVQAIDVVRYRSEYGKGGAVVTIEKQDSSSANNILQLHNCGFGPVGKLENVTVVPFDLRYAGKYCLCVVPLSTEKAVDIERVVDLFPRDSVMGVRKVFRGRLFFFVDVRTLQDFCNILREPPVPSLVSIRPAMSRPSDHGRVGFGDRESRFGNRSSDDLAMRPDRMGDFRRRPDQDPAKCEVPGSGLEKVDLRHSLSNRSIGQVQKREHSPVQGRVVGTAEPEPSTGSQGGEPGHKPKEEVEVVRPPPRRRPSPPLAPPFQRGVELSPRRRGTSSKGPDFSALRPLESPGRKGRDRPVLPPKHPRELDTFHPSFVSEMSEHDRYEYLRLKEGLQEFCSSTMRQNPAVLLLNLPFLSNPSDRSEKMLKEADLKNTVERIYRGVRIVRVRILDVRGGAAIAVVRSEGEVSTLLRDSSREPFVLANRPVQLIEFAHITISGQGYSGSKSFVGDLALLADSPKSKAQIIPTHVDDVFEVRGDSFNVLMVIAMSGRRGRKGSLYRHSVSSKRRSAQRAPFPPPSAHPAMEHGVGGSRNSYRELSHRNVINSASCQREKLLVKNLPDGIHILSLVGNLKAELGLKEWIDAEPGPEPHSAVLAVNSHRAFTSLLTQDGAFITGYKAGSGSLIDVIPYRNGSDEIVHDHASLPTGFSSTQHRRSLSRERGARSPNRKNSFGMRSPPSRLHDHDPVNMHSRHERSGDRRWGERQSRFGDVDRRDPMNGGRQCRRDDLPGVHGDDSLLEKGQRDSHFVARQNRDRTPRSKLVAASCGLSRGFRASPVTPSPSSAYVSVGKKETRPRPAEELANVTRLLLELKDNDRITSRVEDKPPGAYADFVLNMKRMVRPAIADQLLNTPDEEDVPKTSHIWSGLMYMEGSLRAGSRTSTPCRSGCSGSTDGRKAPLHPAHCNGFVVVKERQSDEAVQARIEMLPAALDIEFRQGWDNPKHSELLNEDAVIFMVRSSREVDPHSDGVPLTLEDGFGGEIVLSAVESQKALLGMLRSLRDVQRFGVCRYSHRTTSEKMAALCIPPSAHAFEKLGVPWRFRDMAGHDTMLVVVGPTQSAPSRA